MRKKYPPWLASRKINYRKSGNFRVKNVHAIIFRVKIFSYASRPYENILTTKIFQQRKFRAQSGTTHIEWDHVFSVTTACWRGVAMRQGSLQRGGSILKKGVVVDRRARKMTVRSYGGRYNRLHGNLGREDTCKDGSLEVLVPSRTAACSCRKIIVS